MTQPKTSNSSFRYLIARFKPLANVKVWGSVAIMGLVAVVLWQYSQHPEWVGNGTATSPIEGEFEGEVGNNVDIGVTVQDLQEGRLNSQGFPPQPSQLPTRSLEQPLRQNSGNPSGLPPSPDKQNPNLNPSNPSIEFQPLMPNRKDLGSLFPPLAPSKESSQPIKLPDSALDVGKTPQESPLKDAIEDVFSQESSQENKQPVSPRTRPTSPNYPTSVTPSRNNSSSDSTFNNPYTYSPPQPYTQPYGSGRTPAPVPVDPSSAQFPNAYGNGNSNVNAPNQANQAPPQPNYGIQPSQVNQYGY